jgi:hypothetical protein
MGVAEIDHGDNRGHGVAAQDLVYRRRLAGPYDGIEELDERQALKRWMESNNG